MGQFGTTAVRTADTYGVLPTRTRHRLPTSPRSPHVATRPSSRQFRPGGVQPVVNATFLTPRSRCVAGVLVLTCATLIAYWPALSAGFIWDDDVMLTSNPLVKADDGLYRMWFTFESVDYWPVTGSSFWLEWRLWGMRALGYHLSNVLQHIASALLVWLVLHQLSIPGAWIAACLFALHPVNVESVAWITQRKNTLSQIFLLLSIVWFIRYDSRSRSPNAA